MRNTHRLQSIEREILQLLQATNGGPVSAGLLEYQLWIRHGLPAPNYDTIRPRISYLKSKTGLGIVHKFGHWFLSPALNEVWCEPDKWVDGGPETEPRRFPLK